jgi:hypothetical protein
VRRLRAGRAERAATVALPRLAAAVMDVAARLSANAAMESRRRRWSWIAVVVILTLGPVAFTLARSSSFAASLDLAPVRVGPYERVFEPDRYARLLGDQELRGEMRKNVGVVPKDVDFARGPGRSLRVTVSMPRPEQAAPVANALAAQIGQATRRQLIGRIPADLAKIRRALRSGMLSRAERRAGRRLVRQLRGLMPTPPHRVVVARPATAPRLTRPADRLVDALPGDFPRRPDPLPAGLAGLLLAGTLWALALVLFPPRRREG